MNKLGFAFPEENLPWSPERSIKAMVELGIQKAILSLPDGWPGAIPYNRETAQICKEHPDRFGFFACLPDLRETEAALKELAYVFDELHANGVSMSSSYGEGPNASTYVSGLTALAARVLNTRAARMRAEYIGDDAFEPIWAELDRRGAVVFVHGAQTPSSTPYPHPFLGVPVTEVRPPSGPCVHRKGAH
ncbi:hypothetical protein GY45DRAFT_1316748 [Cubamyces sp. BRFM 1775]|nr:hypothetical protein GY45DRAFT_1316748 [Cubamyces sp. BRFM 1775]